MGEIENALKPVEKEFETDWAAGKVDGWQKNMVDQIDNSDTAGLPKGFWCAACE
jgi:hypothetical protein